MPIGPVTPDPARAPGSRRLPRAAAALLVPLAAVLVALPSCSSDDEASATVTVTGTNDSCEPSSTELDAGTIGFEFTNEADKVNELYVLTEDGEVVSEVENVTTGTSRTLTVDLAAGDYQVRCKPGQTGDGFSTPFTVTGEGGPEEKAADRTITFDAADFAYPDLDLSGLTAGETVRFVMTNTGAQAHEFEVVGPDGETVGEIGSTEPGQEGAATISFDEAGEYTYQCILVDEASQMEHSKMGMTGTFSVAAA